MSRIEIERLERRVSELEALLSLQTGREASPLSPDSRGLPAIQVLNSLILESSRDCITVLDLEGRTRYVSPGGLVGMEISELLPVIGLDWLQVWTGSEKDAARAAMDQAKSGGIGRFQGFCPTHKGQPKWWDVVISAIPGADGAPAHLVTVGRDITDTKIAEQKLRDSEENIKLITDALPVLISYIDADGIYGFANAFYKTWFGKDPSEVVGKGVTDVIGPDIQHLRRAYLDRAFAGEHVRFEGIQDTSNGPRAEDMQYIPRRKSDGSPNGFYVLGFDVTERRRAENESRRLAAIVEQSADFIGVGRPDGSIEFVNEAGRRMIGLPDLASARALAMLDYFPADDHAFVLGTVLPTVRALGYWEGEIRLRDGSSGALTPVFCNIFPVRGGDGAIFGYGTIARDLTERKKAEANQLALIELGDRLREPGDVETIIFAASEILGRTLKISRAGYGLIDHVAETITIPRDWTAPGVASIAGILHFRDYGIYIDDLKDNVPVIIEDVEHDPRTIDTSAALTGIAARAFVNFPIRDQGDVAAIFFLNHTDVRAWTNEDLSFVQKVADRTQATIARQRAEDDLRALAASLEAQVAARTRERDRMWRTSQDLFVICGADGYYRSVNPAWTETLGFAMVELVGMRFDALVHHDDIDAGVLQMERLNQGLVVRDFDVRMRTKTGAYRWFSWHCIPDEDGIYAAGRDITARMELEDQLRQSQKMEAVGQLTGGIAHDFNNLLTGIVGSLDLMQTRIAQGRFDALDRYVNGAMASANRAAALTHRLLAFSRRQPLDPKPVDLNALIASLEDLLRRTMGETTSVEVIAAGGLWMTLCDSNQLESAILNLAINARDAMPEGGKLTIETGNIHLDHAYIAQHAEIEPGQYVCVSVTDTGTGMHPDVVARAFEPFYTTKPLGQGTGLGLSMIYGFTRQSDGHAAISSAVGVGTTLKLYLPRFRGTTEPTDDIDSGADHSRTYNGETVLVVEDEAIVRSLIVEMLIDRGYHALEAHDGPSGLAILQSSGAIDLLVTDVGLPGLNGRQLVQQARETRPLLKVLFITGYAENAMFGNRYLEHGMQMITKPFAIDVLARRISDMIAS